MTLCVLHSPFSDVVNPVTIPVGWVVGKATVTVSAAALSFGGPWLAAGSTRECCCNVSVSSSLVVKALLATTSLARVPVLCEARARSVLASAPWQWLATNAKAAIYARTETLEDGIVANAVSKSKSIIMSHRINNINWKEIALQ